MERPDWDACMEAFGWYRELSNSERTRVSQVGSCESFDRGELIFAPVRDPRWVFLLRRGMVRIARLGDEGNEVAFGFVKPGEVFGELSGLWDVPRESFASAVQPSRVCKMPRKVFQELVGRHPSVLSDVLEQIATRFKRMERRVEHLVLADVYKRVGAILLELCEDFGRSRASDSATRIDQPLTQSDLATLIGASRQTVNGALRRLRDEGLVAHEDGCFVLPKRHELEHIVYGSVR